MFSYEVSDDNKLTRDGDGITENKAQIIHSAEDIIVYASNKQVCTYIILTAVSVATSASEKFSHFFLSAKIGNILGLRLIKRLLSIP